MIKYLIDISVIYFGIYILYKIFNAITYLFLGRISNFISKFFYALLFGLLTACIVLKHSSSINSIIIYTTLGIVLYFLNMIFLKVNEQKVIMDKVNDEKPMDLSISELEFNDTRYNYMFWILGLMSFIIILSFPTTSSNAITVFFMNSLDRILSISNLNIIVIILSLFHFLRILYKGIYGFLNLINHKQR